MFEQMSNQLLFDVLALLPEIMLLVTICAVIPADMLAPLSQSRNISLRFGCLGLLFALLAVGQHPFVGDGSPYPFYYFGGSFVVDRLASLFKLLFVGGALVTLLLTWRSETLAGLRFGEYVVLILGAVLGACVLASANNYVVLLLGLETLSLCSYVLAGYLKDRRESAEASLKYIVYGALASGIMLFGLSYLYGMSGTLDIRESVGRVVLSVAAGQNQLVSVMAVVLVLAGLGFKIAMVPFHFWCPDVYQGAPTPVTAFLSVVSKAAGFSALLRFFVPVLTMPDASAIVASHLPLGAMPFLFGCLAAITMTFGNLVALRQTNAKRLFAYSSIAHAGYLLLALAVLTPASFEAMMVYLFIYFFMNLGAFWVLVILENDCGGSTELDSFQGVASRSPFLFVVLFICLVALTGVPPTAGFSAKFALFEVVVGAGVTQLSSAGALSPEAVFFFALALCGVLNSVVSLYYYMKLARVMVFEKPERQDALVLRPADFVLGVCLAAPVLLFLNFAPLYNLVQKLFEAAHPFILGAFI